MSTSGKHFTPMEFEHFVADLFRRQGYDTHVTKGSADGGIDIEIQKGMVKAVVQCKLYETPAGPAVVRELYGAFIASGADKAICVCTGGFTKGAIQFAHDNSIELMDSSHIQKLLGRSGRSIDSMVEEFFKPKKVLGGTQSQKNEKPSGRSIDSMVDQFFKPKK